MWIWMWIWIDLDWDVDRDTCFGDSVDSVDSVDSDDLGRLFYFLVPTSCLVSSTRKENGSNGSRV